jgi:prepilin-type N-terminal cleavage/methylation domain-containing protein
MCKRGFTIVEFMVALVIVALLAAIAVPGFSAVLQRSRLDAATRQIVSDFRESRSRAISTGWEYRVVGWDADDSGSSANRYRVFARRPPAAWPADDVAPFENGTQLAGQWVNIASRFPGVEMHADSSRFFVTIDSRGRASGTSFNSLELVGHDGVTNSVTVSAVGSVRIACSE